MATRKVQTPQELPKPSLTLPRAEARTKLEDQVKKGNGLHDADIQNPEQLDQLEAERKNWHDYNTELLGTLFDNEKIAKEYEHNSYGAMFMSGTRSLGQEIGDYRESVRYKLNALNSIIGRLDLFSEPVNTASSTALSSRPVMIEGAESNVFIVHGHDNELKEQVARLISDLGLNPIILHEQENMGQTLIEKLERNANKSSFCLLYTSDAADE